jgi:hypothetical protein
VETYNAQKGPLQCKLCQPFAHTQRNCGYEPSCVTCRDAHPSGNCVTPEQQLICCSCGGNHTVKCRGCRKWKEAKAAAAKRAEAERVRSDGVSTLSPAPKSAPPKPFPKHEKLGPVRNHIDRGGCVVKAQATPTPTFTSSDPVRRTERKAAQAGSQCKATCPEVSVVESQPPHPKQTDSTLPPPHRVIRRLRGSPISWRTFLPRPA